jgi:hypothetical protein
MEPVDKVEELTAAMDVVVDNLALESPDVASRSVSPSLLSVAPSALNPAAKVFEPATVKFASPLRQVTLAVTATVSAAASSDDIEMGEVKEVPRLRKGKNQIKEDKEEGEASDDSGAMSDR